MPVNCIGCVGSPDKLRVIVKNIMYSYVPSAGIIFISDMVHTMPVIDPTATKTVWQPIPDTPCYLYVQAFSQACHNHQCIRLIEGLLPWLPVFPFLQDRSHNFEVCSDFPVWVLFVNPNIFWIRSKVAYRLSYKGPSVSIEWTT